LGGGWGAAIDPAGSRAGCCASRVEIERRWKAIGAAQMSSSESRREKNIVAPAFTAR